MTMSSDAGGAVDVIMFVESLADVPEIGVVARLADMLAITCRDAIW